MIKTTQPTKMHNQALVLTDGTELGSRNVRNIKVLSGTPEGGVLEGISSYQGKRIVVKQYKGKPWTVIAQVVNDELIPM